MTRCVEVGSAKSCHTFPFVGSEGSTLHVNPPSIDFFGSLGLGYPVYPKENRMLESDVNSTFVCCPAPVNS